MDDPSEKDLLRVVRNVWPESIDRSAPVTVRASNELRGRHSCFERLENFGKANVIKLARELEEFGLVAMFLSGYVTALEKTH